MDYQQIEVIVITIVIYKQYEDITMNNEEKVKALLAAGKSSEDIVKFLVMNDDYRTGPEARTALETFMNDAGLVQTKKVPMSEQYKTWYTALSRSDKMACTKQSLHAQAVSIGMSEKSADWYARVYLLAGTLALEMSAPEMSAPEMSAPEMSAPAVDIYDNLAEAVMHQVPADKAYYIDERGKQRWYADEVLAVEMSMPVVDSWSDDYVPVLAPELERPTTVSDDGLNCEDFTPADGEPATTLEEYLESLHDAEYEALTIAKRKAFDKKATARFNQ